MKKKRIVKKYKIKTRKFTKNRKSLLKNMLIKTREETMKRIYQEMAERKDELSEDRNQAPLDLGDLSSLDFQQSMENTLLSRETEFLNRLDKALERLKQGSYGICQVCHKEISLVRLQAMPFAENCINCQSTRETRPKKIS